jgi:uncharacterized protein with GYD domain
MATYIMLFNYTEQGIKNFKESPKRQEAAREMARKFGIEVKEIYLTMGIYDFVSIAEASDDQAVAKFALSLGALGNVRTTTLKAFTQAEFRDIVQALT